MATTLTPAPVDSPATQGGALPRVRARRNPVLLAAGAALVVAGAAGVAWLVTSVADASPVLVTAHPIAAGAVIGAGDLAVAQVSLDPAVATIPADQRNLVIGQRAATGLPAGLLLAPDSVTDAAVPAPGTSLVGVAVAPAQLPAVPLEVGDPVTLVVGVKDGAELPDAAAPSMTATVAGSSTLDDGSSVVDVTVPTSRAGQLATWVSTGRVIIVLDPVSGS